MDGRIVIIGAGPTGLGAALRLTEHGYKNWAIYERTDRLGGLAASFTDKKNFTWDIGGHVLFSHYPYFSKKVYESLKGDYLEHIRESWVRLLNVWVPYPFQNNIRYLPKKALVECIMGLFESHKNSLENTPDNFKNWILARFGRGIANYFMFPHNKKTWKHPLESMGAGWIAERVSAPDVKRIVENIIYERDDVGWGPNYKFIFPKEGGTGEIYRRFESDIEKYLFYNKEVCEVFYKKKEVCFKDGGMDKFDFLINTSPLDKFSFMLRPENTGLCDAARNLAHNSILVIGIGLRKQISTSKCWIYFPEESAPFFRMTYFHNYSPYNVPDGNTEKFSALMCDITLNELPAEVDKLYSRALDSLVEQDIISADDKNSVVSSWDYESEYAYPIPTIGRDAALKEIHPFLGKNDIFSRGRFGAWKYEVGNMDHSFMQGVEAVDRILFNRKETVFSI